MPTHLPPGSEPWSAAATRVEEIKGVTPELADLPALEPANAPGLVCRMADTIEALRRRGIRDRIRFASLQEITEALLQERDGARILGTLARYLRQVFNFEEVLVLRRLPRSSTWVGYHACRKHSSTTHLGAVGWRPEWAQPLPSPRTFTEACSGLEGQEREDLADPAEYQVVVPLEGRGVNQVPAADADEAGGIRSVCSASRHLPPTGRSPVGAPTTSGAASKASSRRFGTER